MRGYRSRTGMSFKITALFVVVLTSHGCGRVGPAAIKASRGVYNEAIARTEAQQTLMMIVRNRYGEGSTTLAVNSVAANFRVSTQAGINVGFGPESSYAGNLVPLSGGVAYEDNPTISYTPVHGKQYVRLMLSPISLDLLVPLVRSLEPPDAVITLLVKRINDIKNPDFLMSPAAGPDPRFSRLVKLITQLDSAGVLYWVEDLRKDVEYALVIRGYAPAYVTEVHELLGLLGLGVPEDQSKDIVLPVFLALEGPVSGGIAIYTRSIFELMTMMSASIEAPEDHVSSGLAIKYPPLGPAGRGLHIRRSEGNPQTASVAVKHHGVWFYIDETDQATKGAFRLLQVLYSATIAEATRGTQAAPVLTVPVSR
jgi:hypothetical protein